MPYTLFAVELDAYLPNSTDSVVVGDVNAEQLAQFTKFAQYAGASYCDPVAGKKVHCKGDICPAGEHSNVTIFSTFSCVQQQYSVTGGLHCSYYLLSQTFIVSLVLASLSGASLQACAGS